MKEIEKGKEKSEAIPSPGKPTVQPSTPRPGAEDKVTNLIQNIRMDSPLINYQLGESTFIFIGFKSDF